ncbi:MAG TPA: cytidine deaminase [Ktedonobacterales bacterium]|jgi:cytidine deaminase|nr:cytidine deaminase [Ktedonobacterales bacterium]
MDRQQLVRAAREAAKHAYAPYSKFRVGAAVVVKTPEGPRVVAGANVENASYGLTLCAERNAMASACMLAGAGELPTITHVAVSCIDAKKDATAASRVPCGACRQWLAELAPDAVYYIDGVPGGFHLCDLLPNAFELGR